jgi:hypothetical protein
VTDEHKLRCPACGALAAPGAEWCTQCYEPLGRAPVAGRRAGSPDPRAAIRSVNAPVSNPTPHPPESSHAVRSPQPMAKVFEAVWAPPTNGHSEEASGTSPAVAIPQAPPPPVPVERAPEPERVPGAPETPPDAAGPRAVWTCPVCGNTNDLELHLCATCATPFTRLFEERVERPNVDPRTAAKWSLAFPGLGHARIGRTAEGVSRGVLFVWSLGTALLMLLSHAPALGFIKGLAVLFLLTAAVAYATAAVDAFRQAAGEAPILSPRSLLYATAGLVIMSVGSLFIVVIRATHPH